MKKLIYLLVPMILFLACNNSENTNNETVEVKTEQEAKCCNKENQEKCGESLCVDKVLADPQAYVGKEITVGGICPHICDHSGKNIFIASPENEENILIGKAAEGVGPFDKNLEGKKVKVKGTLRAVEVEEDAEVHHDVVARYFVEVSEVKECTCKGHEGEGCKDHKDGQACSEQKDAKCCADKKV